MKSKNLTMITVVAIAFAAPMIGTGVADDHSSHEVTIETQTLTTNSTEMIEVTVSNPQNSDMISPVVEIPLRNGLSVSDKNRSTEGGTEFVDGITVETDSGVENRTAFISASSFRGTDAVFIEGVNVPANGERTYVIPLTVSGSSEIILEADVRPLNNEDQNIRVSRSIDPSSVGSINATVRNGNSDITISGNSIENTTASGSIVTDIPGNQKYNISTELPNIETSISLTNIEVSEFEEEVVEFTNPTQSGTLQPTVVGTTGSQASVIDESQTRTTTLGNAENRTKQTVSFDIDSSGGQTIIAVETPSNLPMEALQSTPAIGDIEFNKRADGSGIALLETDSAVDDTVTIGFEGRFVGDVNADDNITSTDASMIADRIAENQTNVLTEYADITNSDDISAVDAMQIQQYIEGNRTADYEINGGNQ